MPASRHPSNWLDVRRSVVQFTSSASISDRRFSCRLAGVSNVSRSTCNIKHVFVLEESPTWLLRVKFVNILRSGMYTRTLYRSDHLHIVARLWLNHTFTQCCRLSNLPTCLNVARSWPFYFQGRGIFAIDIGRVAFVEAPTGNWRLKDRCILVASHGRRLKRACIHMHRG